jgi:hypothetical protein
LKIYDRPFQSLVRGDTPIRYPTGEDQVFCRARIVNLDLNAPLNPADDDQLKFSILLWIQKLAELHAVSPRRNWCLCLTLHGELPWGAPTCRSVQLFLTENFNRAPDFAKLSRRVLGRSLYDRIVGNAPVDFSKLNREAQQKILMTFVPKMVAQMVQGQGWRVSTRTNLRYGQADHAPMVTWILAFEHDPRTTSTPATVYNEILGEILKESGRINNRGLVVPD